MEIAVIVVGRNERHWIRACLKSVLDEVPADSVFYVDNASQDGTMDLVREHFRNIHIIENDTNRGFAAGNNQALRLIMEAPKYKYVLLLNPDTLLPSGMIHAMRDFLDDNSDYGIIGPLQVEYDGVEATERLNRVSRRDVQIGPYHVLRRWIVDFPIRVRCEYRTDVLRVYYVQGSALFTSMAVVQDVGMFDETFHSFFEEVDFCRRAQWRGHKAGLLRAWRLPHASRGTRGGSRWRIYLRIRNKYLFVLTDPDIAVRHLPWVVARLAAQDVKNTIFSGRVRDFGTLSFAAAMAWLLLNAPRIAFGRRWRTKVRGTGTRSLIVPL